MPSRVLLECSFLIPIHRDRNLSDGGRHDKKSWDWVEQELQAFGGATISRELYEGWYIDPHTKKRVSDLSRKFYVAVTRNDLGRLRQLLSESCSVFQQKCIYLSVAGKVEFIEGADHA